MAERLRPPANRVARRAMYLWGMEALGSVAGGVVLAVAVVLGVRSASPPWFRGWLAADAWWLPVLAAIVLLPMVVVQPVIRYRVHRWEVLPEVVYTLSGWIDRRWHMVPISRIQTVDTRRGAVERVLGLATVRINTASHAGSSTIRGLPADLAEELAMRVARQANEQRDDAT